MRQKPRWWKPLLAVGAVLAAFCVTFVWPEDNGLDFDIDGSPRARAARSRQPYDLSQVRVLKSVVTKLNQNYVDPERVDHKKMLLAGLNALQAEVAPVLIHYQNGKDSFELQVYDKRKSFRADDVNSPWSLTWRLQEIFEFLQAHLHEEDVELRDVEYATVNGMLRTLDPHSLLLSPEEYSEMQLSTRGQFGGLGIVISIRDGRLTVIRPMPETPAYEAGLEAQDRIVKINDESTLNMPLEEAVKRLRGRPGSTVDVWVVREGPKGWEKPKRFELRRAVIRIESVESKLLSDNVGYIQVKNFQASTCKDMRKALSELHEKQMRALVLDVRGNPGGLLQQAVCVTDTFLSSGTIVTTSANDPSHREQKLAQSKNTEPLYPMVVLANGGSASASEIVAGALKNHDRALVVGQQTFGKGSVQILYNDEQEGWALKLTIAQYLTPGDVSIQGVGIVPDIAIDPMTVDPLDMDLRVDREYIREADLRAHLTNVQAREDRKPSVVLRYYLPRETRQRLREARPEDVEENEQEDEFLTSFSRKLLVKASQVDRRKLLEEAQPVIAEAREEQMARAEAELRKLGVDWSVGEDEGASKVAVEVTTNEKDNTVEAGDPYEIRVKVRNEGDAPVYQLRAVTKSDYQLFDGRELVFGKLKPGQSRTWSTTLGVCRSEDGGKRECRIPLSTRDRADGVRVVFDEAHGHAPDEGQLRTRIESQPRPQFAYALHVADAKGGNGDGKLQPGELATVYFDVRNAGEGRSYETQANLRNLSGPGVLLKDGRFQINNLEPGEKRSVAFTFEVAEDYQEDAVKVEVSVVDTDLHESVTEKLELPVFERTDAKVEPAEGKVVLGEGTVIRSAPAKDAKSVATVAGGPLQVGLQAKLGAFRRVDLGDGRPGWVSADAFTEANASASAKLSEDLNHMPPQLEIDYGNTLVTREPTLQIEAVATDDDRVRDMYVFVGTHKVHYQSNRNSGSKERAQLATEIPLNAGINYVTVVARESHDVVSRRTFVVRRDAPDGSLMETPTMAEKPFFWSEEAAPPPH